jgi:microcompartment protein CcmK/EutM
LSGQTFTITDNLLKFMGAGKGAFTVPLKSIETVTVDQVGAGSSELKIIGKGTVLASVVLPRTWVTKTQEWLLENLNL